MNENEVKLLIRKHDDKWFELLHKTQIRYTFIICIILTFVFGIISFLIVGYYRFPPIKNQVVIKDNEGNSINVEDGSIIDLREKFVNERSEN